MIIKARHMVSIVKKNLHHMPPPHKRTPSREWGSASALLIATVTRPPRLIERCPKAASYEWNHPCSIPSAMPSRSPFGGGWGGAQVRKSVPLAYSRVQNSVRVFILTQLFVAWSHIISYNILLYFDFRENIQDFFCSFMTSTTRAGSP